MILDVAMQADRAGYGGRRTVQMERQGIAGRHPLDWAVILAYIYELASKSTG